MFRGRASKQLFASCYRNTRETIGHKRSRSSTAKCTGNLRLIESDVQQPTEAGGAREVGGGVAAAHARGRVRNFLAPSAVSPTIPSQKRIHDLDQQTR